MSELNQQQREIISCKDGAYLVSAVPGSGKTTCVTHRVAELIRSGVHPENILAVTFTNKAAKEMRDRVGLLLNVPGRPTLSTFHSFCAQQLREYYRLTGRSRNFNIIDQGEQEKLIKQLFKTECGPDAEIDKKFIKNIIRYLEFTRENLEKPEETAKRLELSEIQLRIAHKYLEVLPSLDAFDFTGLLANLFQILRTYPEIQQKLNNRYKYLMVDEFQDTNLIQYELVKLLGAHGNVMVVGDLDQSLYSFRLAVPENLIHFEEDFKAKTLFLEFNYRSTPEILAASQHLIEHNKLRKPTQLKTNNESGHEVKTLHADTELEMVEDGIRLLMRMRGKVKPSQIAVLYRTNAASLVWEKELRKCQIPYKLIGGFSFFTRQEVKLSLSVLKVLLNSSDSISFLQVCEACCAGFGEKASNAIMSEAQEKHMATEAVARLAPKTKLKEFLDILDVARTKDAPTGLLHVFKSTKVWADLKAESEEDNDRCENVTTLCDDLTDFLKKGGELLDYLQQAALASASDETTKDECINLMTIHAAKGLEFEIVLVSHLVEGMLPHSFAFAAADPAKAIEEERRILYVAMTRAKQWLILAHFSCGRFSRSSPSRFLSEIL